MRKNDLLLILLILVLSGILYAASKNRDYTTSQTPSKLSFIPSAAQTNQIGQADQSYAATKQPLHTESTTASSAGEANPSPAPTLAPAKCYMLVRVGDVVFLPYPLLEKADLPITQSQGQTNTVHITTEGFSMGTASCDNHECVYQGEVTLENRDLRLLGNQVICLPNQVSLELLNPQEAAIVWENAYGK